MAERTVVFERVQLGPEVTPGTKVAATKKVSGLELAMGSRVDISKYRASGMKFPSVASLNKEWSEGSLSGPVTYTELVYLLSSVIAGVTPTGATTAKTWAFSPDSDGPDSKQTYTLECGSAVRGHRFGYGLVTGLGMKFTRSGSEISGSVLAQKMEDDFTMTTGLAEIPLVPVLGNEILVYFADAQADLDSATKLNRPLSAEWNLGDRYGPVWAINGDDSFSADVETEPKLEVKLMMEADAEGMALLTTMREGATKFVRIEATSGQEVEVGTPYKITVDTACKVMDVGDISDEDGLIAIEWSMEAFHDSTWGKATEVTTVNGIASL